MNRGVVLQRVFEKGARAREESKRRVAPYTIETSGCRWRTFAHAWLDVLSFVQLIKKALSKREWFRVLRARGINTAIVSRRVAKLCASPLDVEKGRALKFLFKGGGFDER